jgi:hypothetical protein
VTELLFENIPLKQWKKLYSKCPAAAFGAPSALPLPFAAATEEGVKEIRPQAARVAYTTRGAVAGAKSSTACGGTPGANDSGKQAQQLETEIQEWEECIVK